MTICGLYSTSVETLQLFVPGRETSALDLLTNVLGSMIGVLLGLLLEDVFVRPMEIARKKTSKSRDLPDRAALALLACWVAWLWFPLFPVMGRTLLSYKLHAALATPWMQAVPFVSGALAWFAAGNLLYQGGLRPARRLLAISVLLIPAQLFITDRQPVPAEFLGAIGGTAWFVFIWPRRKTSEHAYWNFTGWAFLCAIVFRGLAPFHFSATAAPFSWIPFDGFLNMRWQSGIQLIAEKFFWYGTSIWLLRAAGMRARTAIAVVAAILLAIEIAQTRLPGHVAEITDPLWAIFSGIALLVLAPRVNPAPPVRL